MHIFHRPGSSAATAAERKVRKKNRKISYLPNHTFVKNNRWKVISTLG